MVGALLWIGAFHLFQKGHTYESFFAESVGGLSPGSSVKYLGVKVGRVKSVRIAPDGKLIEVVFEIKKSFKIAGRNMAVQKSSQGITGNDYLSLTEAPSDIGSQTPQIQFAHRYPVIPSLKEQNSMDAIFKQAEGLINSFKQTAKDADSLLKDPRINEAIAKVREISEEIERLTGKLSENGNPEKLNEALDNVAAAANNARKSTEDIEKQLSKLPANSLGDLDKRVDQSMALVRQDLAHLSQVLTDLGQLIESMKENPGRILTRPKGEQPFKR